MNHTILPNGLEKHPILFKMRSGHPYILSYLDLWRAPASSTSRLLLQPPNIFHKLTTNFLLAIWTCKHIDLLETSTAEVVLPTPNDTSTSAYRR